MITSPAPQGDRDRERLRILIAQAWQRAGRFSWSDAAMDAAIDEAIRRRATTPPADATPPPTDPPEPRSVQPTLFGPSAATRKTRAIAAASSLATGPSRRELVARYVASCGDTGATRDAIAEALDLPIQTVCPLVKAMERSGRLVSTSRTRKTRNGKPAAVLIAPEFARRTRGGQ